MARNGEPGMPVRRKATSGSGKWSDYQPRLPEAGADWAKVDEAAILIAIANVTNEGAAILFAKTRDGGALVITLCDGDERRKFYATTREEMALHLRELADRASG